MNQLQKQWLEIAVIVSTSGTAQWVARNPFRVFMQLIDYEEGTDLKDYT